MVRVGASLQGLSHQQKDPEACIQSCRIGDVALYSERITRGSEHPSRRGRKLGFVNGDGHPELTTPEEAVSLESRQTEIRGNRGWGDCKGRFVCGGCRGVRGAVDEQVEEIWVLVQLWLMVLRKVTSFFCVAGGPAEMLIGSGVLSFHKPAVTCCHSS